MIKIKHIILDVEFIVIGLFTTGFMTINTALLDEIDETSKICTEYKLDILANNLNDISSLLKQERDSENSQKLTEKTLLLVKCIDILKTKISYDELGGY